MMELKKQFLNVGVSGKTIYLTEAYNEKRNISPEDAFTHLKYYGYKTSEKDVENTWDIINNIENYNDIDDYGFCTVVSENYYNAKGKDKCFDEISERCGKRGSFPDYILLRRKGRLNLIHQSIDIESLKNKPFVPTEERLEDGGGSFSIGLYVLDLTHNKYLQSEPNCYTGVYEGYYYECIEDLHNGEKCGGKNISQKEFFIPRGVETIMWN